MKNEAANASVRPEVRSRAGPRMEGRAVAGVAPIAHENTVHTVSQVLTMLWLVAAGRGIAFVPASAARLPIDGVGFTRLATAVAEPVELHLLWLKESANPALGRTVRVLEDCVPLSHEPRP